MINPNMDDFKAEHRELYHSILKLKQQELLHNRVFSVRKTVDNDIKLHLKNCVINDQIKNVIARELSDHILKNVPIKTEETPFDTRFEADLIVLNKGELYHILEYLITNLSDEQIQKIKNR